MSEELISSEVTECNHNMIHCRKANGTEYSIKANRKRLEDIYMTARDNASFYFQMYSQLKTEYEKRRNEFDKIKRYSDEEIEEAKNWRKYGLIAASEMEWKNKTRLEKFYKVSGFYDACSWAYDMYAKYDKLARQAKGGLK